MHCHYELHVSIGMAAVFIIEDGPTVASILPPPPDDLPKCNHDDDGVFNELEPYEGKDGVSQS